MSAHLRGCSVPDNYHIRSFNLGGVPASNTRNKYEILIRTEVVELLKDISHLTMPGDCLVTTR